MMVGTEEENFNWAEFEEYTARVTAMFAAREEAFASRMEAFSNYEFACFEAFSTFFLNCGRRQNSNEQLWRSVNYGMCTNR